MEDLFTIFQLKPLEIEVYLKLFEKKDSTVKDIVKVTDISRAKIYNILSILEEKGLITSIPAKTGKTRVYNVVNPKNLYQLQRARLKELERKSEEIIMLLQEKFDKLYSKGLCQIKPTHFLITEKRWALSKIIEYVSRAKKEIILIGVPLWLIDHLFEFLLIAHNEKNCKIEIYLPDFEIIPSKYNKIKKFSPKVIKIPHYQFIEINQKLYLNCEMIVDRKYMISINYNKEYDVIIHAFSGINCITQCILPNLYQTLITINHKKPSVASKENRIIEVLKREGKRLSKKELSIQTGLSGHTLNKTLNKLLEQNKIKIIREKLGTGRPRITVQLVS
ncbi:MAG: TrmB family transcriptional regulator [Candidatus Helarchaeota archaeon]